SMSSSTEAIPSSRYRTMAFFGPRPGTDISRRTPSGICARSSSSAAMVPVRRYSSTFSPIDLPTLGMARIPLRSSVERSAGYPPTARAAFSYARGLKGSSDRIDRRSAYSRRMASTASFTRGTTRTSPRRSERAEQPEQKRLLGVHPVLGLVPHGRMRSVDHLGGDLLPAVRGQAVQDHDVGLGKLHLALVDLVGGEHERPLLRLRFLPHARPNVGVQDVGSSTRLDRVVQHPHRSPA